MTEKRRPGRPVGSKDGEGVVRRARWERVKRPRSPLTPMDEPLPNYIAHGKTGKKHPPDGSAVTMKPWALMGMLLYGTQSWLRRHGEGGITFPVRQACVALRCVPSTLKDYIYYLRDMGIITSAQLHPHFVYLTINCPIGLMRELTYVEKHHPTNITIDTARGGVRFLSNEGTTPCENRISGQLSKSKTFEGVEYIDAGGAGPAGIDKTWFDEEMGGE